MFVTGGRQALGDWAGVSEELQPPATRWTVKSELRAVVSDKPLLAGVAIVFALFAWFVAVPIITFLHATAKISEMLN